MDEAQLRQAIWDAMDHEILDAEKPSDRRYIREQLRFPQEEELEEKEGG